MNLKGEDVFSSFLGGRVKRTGRLAIKDEKSSFQLGPLSRFPAGN